MDGRLEPQTVAPPVAINMLYVRNKLLNIKYCDRRDNMKLITASTIALLMSLGALLASNALAANGLSKIPIKLKVVQTQFRTSQDTNGDGEVAYQLTSHYIGAPGRAESTGLSEVGDPADPEGLCPADFLFPIALPILVLEDALVFQDLSTLYISGTGLLCFDFATFTGEITADFDVVGGTGRFAGASGQIHADFPDIYSPFVQYSVVIGQYDGTVYVP